MGRQDRRVLSSSTVRDEVGTLQALADIASIAHARGVLVHTDAAQSVGKVPVNVDDLGVDLLTIAGHKFYATKGAGALYVRHGTPIAPLTAGVEHERGVRPGIENVPDIVGLGEAARLARERLHSTPTQLRRTRNLLHRLLADGVPGLILNGHDEHRLPNTLNVSFPAVEGRELLRAAGNDVAASVGSACHAGDGTVSGVLAAMGIGIDRAAGAVRLSVGIFTTEDEIRHAAHALVSRWRELRGGDAASRGEPPA